MFVTFGLSYIPTDVSSWTNSRPCWQSTEFANGLELELPERKGYQEIEKLLIHIESFSLPGVRHIVRTGNIMVELLSLSRLITWHISINDRWYIHRLDGPAVTCFYDHDIVERCWYVKDIQVPSFENIDESNWEEYLNRAPRAAAIVLPELCSAGYLKLPQEVRENLLLI